MRCSNNSVDSLDMCNFNCKKMLYKTQVVVALRYLLNKTDKNLLNTYSKILIYESPISKYFEMIIWYYVTPICATIWGPTVAPYSKMKKRENETAHYTV